MSTPDNLILNEIDEEYSAEAYKRRFDKATCEKFLAYMSRRVKGEYLTVQQVRGRMRISAGHLARLLREDEEFRAAYFQILAEREENVALDAVEIADDCLDPRKASVQIAARQALISTLRRSIQAHERRQESQAARDERMQVVDALTAIEKLIP